MKREEAINVIRVNYPHVAISGSKFETALRELIPELKESEDERARNGLINFLNQPNIADKITFDARTLWLDYLEKQKEQKSTEWSEELGAPVNGEVHHALNCHYLATDDTQLCARLRDFPEGAKVDVYIVARKEGGE